MSLPMSNAQHPLSDPALLRSVIEQAPMGMLLLRSEDAVHPVFRILHANATMRTVLGLGPVDAAGTRITEASPGAFNGPVLRRLKRACEERTAQEVDWSAGDEFGQGSPGPHAHAVPMEDDVVLVMTPGPISVEHGNADVKKLEHRFRMLLESAPDAMVIADERGIIQLVNAQAERIFGYAKPEMLGQPVEMLMPQGARSKHEAHRAGYIGAPRPRMMGQGLELQGRRKDGSVFPVEIALSPLETDGGVLVSAAVRDISERKRIEDAKQHLVAIMRSSNDAIISMDTDARITSWNPGAEQVFGYPAAEMIGRHVADLIPEDRRGTEHELDRRVLSGQDHVEHYETVRKRKDGSLVAVSLTISPIRNERGVITGASKFAHDITERRKAQAELERLNRTLEQRIAERTADLQKSEKRYHDALDVLMEGVQIISTDHRYLYVNDALVQQSGYTRDELLGATMMERYPGIEKSPMFEALQECLQRREARVMENEFVFPDGSRRVFNLSIQPVAEGLFILSSDITERKKAEAEVAAQRTQLEEQNKELEQFAYIASHDLQEPLRMVTSYVQLLQRRYGDKLDADALEFIAYAVDGAERMKQLINDLLAFSRLGRPSLQDGVDLDVVLGMVLVNLDTAIKEASATVTSDPLPTLTAARTEMLQLFQNLIGNAVKFRRDGVPPVVVVTCRDEGDHWAFSVRDNGIGMDEQYSAKVFTPFKRLHDRSKYAGSGIGLAVAQKIVHRYGGRIRFNSVPGEGTTFHFTILKHMR